MLINRIGFLTFVVFIDKKGIFFVKKSLFVMKLRELITLCRCLKKEKTVLWHFFKYLTRRNPVMWTIEKTITMIIITKLSTSNTYQARCRKNIKVSINIKNRHFLVVHCSTYT